MTGSRVPEGLTGAGVIAAVSTRQGGVSGPTFGLNLSFRVGDREEAVQRNRERFFGGLGIPLEQLAIPGQIHGTTICQAATPGTYPDCDGLVTDRPGVFLCITVADCLPVLIFAPDAGACGAFHAGWRGTAGRIAAAGVKRLGVDFGADPGKMIAWIGPGASACCYQVGEEVAGKLQPQFVLRRGNGIYADLKAANASQLQEAGVPAKRIEIDPGCTIMEPALFHSFRRDGNSSGRMMAVIGKPHASAPR